VTTFGLFSQPLELHASAPLWRQLYDQLRGSILDGSVAPGARLPSTRDLARELAVSRTTVLNAFEQLLAEGYIEGRTGSGSYVARILPEDMLSVGRGVDPPPEASDRRASLSQGGALLATLPQGLFQGRGRALRPFLPWTPALDAFPVRTWARLVERRWANPSSELLARGDPAGYWPLREVIAAYLGPARGVRCAPEQVIVVAGMQQAF
jgi:GntR family transcriptional regulator/MocR family aminotransferase